MVSPWNVALMTFKGFVEPIIFALMSLTPARLQTAATALWQRSPVPGQRIEWKYYT